MEEFDLKERIQIAFCALLFSILMLLCIFSTYKASECDRTINAQAVNCCHKQYPDDYK